MKVDGRIYKGSGYNVCGSIHKDDLLPIIDNIIATRKVKFIEIVEGNYHKDVDRNTEYFVRDLVDLVDTYRN